MTGTFAVNYGMILLGCHLHKPSKSGSGVGFIIWFSEYIITAYAIKKLEAF